MDQKHDADRTRPAHMESRGAFGVLLRDYRLAAGLTQDALAERAGLSVRGIADLERGARRFPHPATIERLSHALGLSAAERAAFDLASRPPRAGTDARPVANHIAVGYPDQVRIGRDARYSLPLQLTSFVGREREVPEVTKRLRDPAVRLLTLVGPGGTGKTRLAVEAAGSVLVDFADGVFLVDLAPLTDPGLVTSTIAKVLGVREVAGQALLETLQHRLRDEQLLLVADNFEHLLAGATVIVSLLLACPRLKVLTTSRTPLRVYGEYELHVPPLGLPDLRASDTSTVARTEAVLLFVDRAQATGTDFRLDEVNTRIVGEICVRLDGLPLAIELAAARVRVLSPRALLSLLKDRLSVLTGGAQTLPRRQQTLRATLDWSNSLLAPAEQALFRRLAVFVGGWTMEAAEAVCSQGQGSPLSVLDGLEKLARASLVQVVEMEQEARFQMLETVREYALERVEASGELEAVKRAHATFFLALAEQAEHELMGSEQRAWLGQLEREHDNLRAALRWSVECRQVEHGLRLGGALWRFWQTHGHLTEGRARLMELLGLTQAGILATQRTVARATALRGAGALAWRQGDYSAAWSLHAESLAISRELRDRRGIAFSLNSMGLVPMDQGDYATARSLFEESLAIFRELRDRWGIAYALEGLARVATIEGQAARALRLAAAAAKLRQAIGAPLPPAELEQHKRALQRAEQALSQQERTAAWAEGATMPLEQALDEALALEPTVPSAAKPTPPGGARPGQAGPLTPIEFEVAALLARGLTNRQIAQVLVISEKSAGIHVEDIVGKLGFQSRAQVAAWITERQLQRSP